MGHGAVIQPEAVAQEPAFITRPQHTGEEPQPHLHLAVQTDTFTWNLCTIRIEIGAVLAIIAQEPPRNLHHLFHDPACIFKSFTTTFRKKHHQISAILTDLQEDFPERLSRTANFAEHFVYIVYPFQGNLRNPPHPAGNRRANRRNLLN